MLLAKAHAFKAWFPHADTTERLINAEVINFIHWLVSSQLNGLLEGGSRNGVWPWKVISHLGTLPDSLGFLAAMR